MGIGSAGAEDISKNPKTCSQSESPVLGLMGIGPSGAIGVFKTCETCSLSESPVLSPMPIIGASDYPVVLSFPTGSKVYSVFALSLGIGPSGQES